jgi:hypothetical protein
MMTSSHGYHDRSRPLRTTRMQGSIFSRDPSMPVPPGDVRGEIGKSPPVQFLFFAYVIFMSFEIYIMFFG